MALIIRMRQLGSASRQRFRIVVADSRDPRDGGRYVEKLGWYNPFGADDANFQVDIDRVRYWLDLGAEISDRVKSLVKRRAPEVIQGLSEKKVAKMTKERTKRKARTEKKPAPAKKAAAKK